MSDLEERGLLSSPHASAGRIPTDLAYRLYVDRLMSRPPIDAGHAHAIDEALQHRRGEIQELLSEAARQLSRVSQHVGVVLVPDMRRIIVEHLEFVRLDGHRVVVPEPEQRHAVRNLRTDSGKLVEGPGGITARHVSQILQPSAWLLLEELRGMNDPRRTESPQIPTQSALVRLCQAFHRGEGVELLAAYNCDGLTITPRERIHRAADLDDRVTAGA